MTESRLPRATSLAATRNTRSQRSGLAALANGKGPAPPTQTSALSAPAQSTRARSKAQNKSSSHRATASVASNAPSTASTATTGKPPQRSTRSTSTRPQSALSQNVALNNAKRIVAPSTTVRQPNSATPPAHSPPKRPTRGHKRQSASVSTAEAARGVTRSSSIASRLANKLEPLTSEGRTIPQPRVGAVSTPSSHHSRSPTPAESAKTSPKTARPCSTQTSQDSPGRQAAKPLMRSASMVTSTPQRPRRRAIPDTPAFSSLLSAETSTLQPTDVSIASDTSFIQMTPPRPPKSGSLRLVRSDSSPMLSLSHSKSMNSSKSAPQFAHELGRLRAQRTELEEKLSAMKAEETRLQSLMDKTMRERQAAVDSCADMEAQKNQALWNGIINACEEAIESEQDFKATLDSLRVLVTA